VLQFQPERLDAALLADDHLVELVHQVLQKGVATFKVNQARFDVRRFQIITWLWPPHKFTRWLSASADAGIIASIHRRGEYPVMSQRPR